MTYIALIAGYITLIIIFIFILAVLFELFIEALYALSWTIFVHIVIKKGTGKFHLSNAVKDFKVFLLRKRMPNGTAYYYGIHKGLFKYEFFGDEYIKEGMNKGKKDREI